MTEVVLIGTELIKAGGRAEWESGFMLLKMRGLEKRRARREAQLIISAPIPKLPPSQNETRPTLRRPRLQR